MAAGGYVLRLLTLAAGMSAVCYGYQVLLGGQDPAHNPHLFAFVFPVRYFVFAAIFLTATVSLAAAARMANGCRGGVLRLPRLRHRTAAAGLRGGVDPGAVVPAGPRRPPGPVGERALLAGRARRAGGAA